MNERIKELATEAGLLTHNPGGTPTKLEKFAELIVRKCAEVSKNYADGSMPISIAIAIKQHFGVKE
jgi:hypothetical protein